MIIKDVNIEDIKPYEFNAKKHDKIQIKNVAESIKQFGFVQPLVINKDGVIIIGHCRYQAAKRLKLKTIPCLFVENLTDEQVKKLRNLDNKLNESEWDFDLLCKDIEGLDFSDFEIDWNIDKEEPQQDGEQQEKYTTKIDVPQYQIKGEKPNIKELFDDEKCKQLCEEINTNQDLSKEEKDFLTLSAYRHVVFHYDKIAEFYANSSKEMQSFMEKSALVIIDFDDAIKNGYTQLSEEVSNMYLEDEQNQ